MSSRRGGLTAALRVASAAALVFVLASSPAHAGHSYTNTVANACVTPTLTSTNVTANGTCGRRFALPAHPAYNGYQVSSTPGADLDIHFYNGNAYVTGNSGPPIIFNQCVNLVGTVPPTATHAIVVMTPNTCGSSSNVSFTYTSTP